MRTESSIIRGLRSNGRDLRSGTSINGISIGSQIGISTGILVGIGGIISAENEIL